MLEASTTPDLVELTRRVMEAANRHDLDAVMRPDFYWDSERAFADLGLKE